MKLQDIIVPVTLAFLVTWGIQYIFVTKKLITPATTDVRSGQSFRVSTPEQMARPIITEIDFIDTDLEVPVKTQEVVKIAFPQAHYAVTPAGGCLDYMAFAHKADKHEWLVTLDSQDNQKENDAFLIAFEKNTPYNYHLKDEKEDDQTVRVTYQTESQDATITKTLIFYKKLFKIDIDLMIEPRSGKTVQPRLLLPAPQFKQQILPVKGLVFTDNQMIQKQIPAEIEHNVWASPTLFGSEDTYFIHALVADPDHFVERAYYKIIGKNSLIAYLEGPLVQQKSSWKMSFYCGPKRVESLAAVDPRLEETLDYGWFAPISKFLLLVLNTIYRYVHNYGWAIVILTLLLRLIMLPFTFRAHRSATKRSELSRKMQYLEQKYKHDREALAREKMELIRKHGVMPDAAGCLPNLLYIPVFIGLNRLLNNSIELYHAPFIGWITDLSVKDPYYVLPALIALGIIFQQGFNKDPRQTVAMVLLALVVAGFTAQLSAGLALFICVSTLSGVAQVYLQKLMEK